MSAFKCKRLVTFFLFVLWHPLLIFFLWVYLWSIILSQHYLWSKLLSSKSTRPALQAFFQLLHLSGMHHCTQEVTLRGKSCGGCALYLILDHAHAFHSREFWPLEVNNSFGNQNNSLGYVESLGFEKFAFLFFMIDCQKEIRML